MEHFLKRTWAEIDLDAVKHNYFQIRSLLKDNTKLMCIVKADAYGHGAEFLAREYQNLGAEWFGVSNIEEAMQLRNFGINKPILILGYTPVYMIKELANFHITQTVFSKSYAENLSAEALKYGLQVNVHIKIDTGMSRIGFMFQDKIRDSHSLDDIEEIFKLQGINVEGIFTHFSVADDAKDGEINTRKQFENFQYAIARLKERGLEIKLVHCCNSGGIVNFPDMHLDIVRAGLILYGFFPSDNINNKINLKPVMQFKTVVSQVKEVDHDTAISYGRTFITPTTMKIATVPIGYADGYARSLSSKASMLINGQRAPVLGRICMDQLMLDVTNVKGVKAGSIVTVFGKSENEYLPASEIWTLMGTINYEFLCLIGKRVPRVYLKNKKNIGQLNYIYPIKIISPSETE